MYKVEIYHFKPAYVRGDLESETSLEYSEVFKLRSSAKTCIEGKLRGKDSKKISRHYHIGDSPSYVYYSTGYKWQNENSGEMLEEYYTYKLSKVKPK